MKITLIHPSRGRPQKAFYTHIEWLKCASGDYEIEHLLSLDTDDTKLNDYKCLFESYLEYPNTCVVEATNHAAKFATGDIMVYLSDDFKCPDNWDKLIIEAFGDKINTPCLLKVDDCLQKFHVDVVTIPIMTNMLYNNLGYFFHTEYKSMFCDQHLYWACKNRGWLLEAPHLKFEHYHYSIGKSFKDETYARSDNNWEQGKALYALHQKQNFPI